MTEPTPSQNTPDEQGRLARFIEKAGDFAGDVTYAGMGVVLLAALPMAGAVVLGMAAYNASVLGLGMALAVAGGAAAGLVPYAATRLAMKIFRPQAQSMQEMYYAPARAAEALTHLALSPLLLPGALSKAFAQKDSAAQAQPAQKPQAESALPQKPKA